MSSAIRVPPNDKYIYRKIVIILKSEDCRYEHWMRGFISPKYFWKIRREGWSVLDMAELTSTFCRLAQSVRVSCLAEDIEYLQRRRGRLGLLISMVALSRVMGNAPPDLAYRTLLTDIFWGRIERHNELSFEKDYWNNISGVEELHVVAPVCPDYNYIGDKDGRYRYTFDGMGNGVGLVASKAIASLDKLVGQFSESCIQQQLVKPLIAVGDFEAKDDNLKALGLEKGKFLENVSNSAKTISSQTGYNTILFTSICGGIEEWHSLELLVERVVGISCFDELVDRFPDAKTEKRYISRLPLYRRWFGEMPSYKGIFYRQAIEYMTMGFAVKVFLGKNAFILASDHKAMRFYYNAISEVPVIGISSQY